MKSQDKIASDIRNYGVLGHMYFLFSAAVYEAESAASTNPIMTIPLSREQLALMDPFEKRVDRLRRMYEDFKTHNKKVLKDTEERFALENYAICDEFEKLRKEIEEKMLRYQEMSSEIDAMKSRYLESAMDDIKDADRVVELHKVACDIYLREIRKVVHIPDDNDVIYNKDISSVVLVNKVDLKKLYVDFVSTHLKGKTKDVVISAYDIIAETEDKELLDARMLELVSSLNSGDESM